MGFQAGLKYPVLHSQASVPSSHYQHYIASNNAAHGHEITVGRSIPKPFGIREGNQHAFQYFNSVPGTETCPEREIKPSLFILALLESIRPVNIVCLLNGWNKLACHYQKHLAFGSDNLSLHSHQWNTRTPPSSTLRGMTLKDSSPIFP
jgi:hypothetical protein